jgi:hypothetical protein
MNRALRQNAGALPGRVGLVTPPAELGHDPPAPAGVEPQRHRPDEVTSPDHRGWCPPEVEIGDMTREVGRRKGARIMETRYTSVITEHVFGE